jgi:hypothetical protein
VHFLLVIFNIIPLYNCLISSSGLRSPSHGRTLQASMFASPEKPFLLLEYAEAMARALTTSRPTFLPSPRILGDPRVLNFFDLSKDFATTLSSYDSDDEGSLDSFQSSSESRFYSKDALVVLDATPLFLGVLIMVVYHSLFRWGHLNSVLLAGLLAFSFGVFILARLQGHCL